MNPWKLEFLIFILLVASCGDNKDNTVILQENLKKESLPESSSKPDQISQSTRICSQAHNKDDLLILIEDDGLPKETTENHYYIEEKCESFTNLFNILKKHSCSSTTNPIPRHARGGTIQHEMAPSRKKLKNLFLDRIEKSKPYEKVDSYGYEHRIHDYLTGNVWLFNLCFPLVAQPTKIIYK